MNARGWLQSYAQGPRLLRLVAYGIIFAVLLAVLINYPGGTPDWHYFGMAGALAALLVLNIVWSDPSPADSPWQRAAHDWAFLSLSAALILASIVCSGQFDVAYLLLITCLQAGLKRGVWPAGLAFAGTNLAAWLALQLAWHLPAGLILSLDSNLAAGLVFVLLLGLLLLRYQRQTERAESLLSELQAANHRLAAAHRQEADLAIAEERVRLARDIHDGLGHHLTVLSIQLQAAGKLVARNPAAAGSAIQACQAEAQAALDEVRLSVGMMRQSPGAEQPMADTLAALVRTFAERTGMIASFEASGAPVALSPLARQTLFRAAQEALTNTRRHACEAQRVAVRLAYDTVSVRLRIWDDGCKLEPALCPTTGYGLQGLRERAGQLGGTCHSGPGRERGFEVEMCLPLEGNEP